MHNFHMYIVCSRCTFLLGIRLHLVESVKLCGLKKAREKSILDMIITLCNHLTSREDEINRWIEFADRVALSAAEKLDRSMQECQAVCEARDDAQNDANDGQSALLTIKRELHMLKNDLLVARDGVSEVMTHFPPLIRECEDRLRQEVRNHCDGLRSGFGSHVRDTVEGLKMSHDGERQRLSDVIISLENSNRMEVENAKSLRIQLDDAAVALEEEKNASASAQEELSADAVKARCELRGAMDRIESLEAQLEKERIQKKKELFDVEERMRSELDAIDQKVKQSFKSCRHRKPQAIAEKEWRFIMSTQLTLNVKHTDLHLGRIQRAAFQPAPSLTPPSSSKSRRMIHPTRLAKPVDAIVALGQVEYIHLPPRPVVVVVVLIEHRRAHPALHVDPESSPPRRRARERRPLHGGYHVRRSDPTGVPDGPTRRIRRDEPCVRGPDPARHRLAGTLGLVVEEDNVIREGVSFGEGGGRRADQSGSVSSFLCTMNARSGWAAAVRRNDVTAAESVSPPDDVSNLPVLTPLTAVAFTWTLRNPHPPSLRRKASMRHAHSGSIDDPRRSFT